MTSRPQLELPERVSIRVEVPRWGLVKRRSDGSVDYVSPFPCPYNYGCIPAFESDDGDALDVVVLGRRLPRGAELVLPVRAVMGFTDDGAADPKVICSGSPLSPDDARGIWRFFKLYALVKTALGVFRGQRAVTRCDGWLSWRRSPGGASLVPGNTASVQVSPDAPRSSMGTH
jgi:inorganic pyrophosphatase